VTPTRSSTSHTSNTASATNHSTRALPVGSHSRLRPFIASIVSLTSPPDTSSPANRAGRGRAADQTNATHRAPLTAEKLVRRRLSRGAGADTQKRSVGCGRIRRRGVVARGARSFCRSSAFRPNLRLPTGWNSWCRACCAERTRQWRADHPEQRLRRRVAPAQLQCVECGASFEVVRIGSFVVLAAAKTRGIAACTLRRRVRSNGGRVSGGAKPARPGNVTSRRRTPSGLVRRA
jgi:hypothetical protein